MELVNDSGTGLKFIAKDKLSVSAWPYTMEQLEAAKHTFDLPVNDNITVNVDYKQMGIGGDDSWGAQTHPQYTLPPRTYSYGFRIEIIR